MIYPPIDHAERAYTLADSISSAGALAALDIRSDGTACAYYRKPGRTGATISRHYQDAGALVVGYGQDVQRALFYVRFRLMSNLPTGKNAA